MSAASPSPAVLTLEDFLVKYPKLKLGFELEGLCETFVGKPESAGVSESKEEFVGPLKFLDVIKTINAHMKKRWPSPDGRKYFSTAELECLKELVSISNLNACIHAGKELNEIIAYFHSFYLYGIERLSDLNRKLLSQLTFNHVKNADDLFEILSACFMLPSNEREGIFQRYRGFYDAGHSLIKLKIAAVLARNLGNLSLELMSRINFYEPMPSLTEKEITYLLNNLDVCCYQFSKKKGNYDSEWAFRLHAIGTGFFDDDDKCSSELSFFALRLPVLGSIAAEAVSQFSSHKKSICEKIMAIPKLSIRIQILHALLYEEGSIGYQGIRVKRGFGPFSKPCSVLSGNLFRVSAAYHGSLQALIHTEALPVLQNTLDRFQESGMYPIPEDLTKKIQELGQADLGHTLSGVM
jgi:hypothetical protein